MTSINSSAANSTEKAEPVLPARELAVGRNGNGYARAKKAMASATDTPIAVRQAVERIPATTVTEATNAASARGQKPAGSGASKTEMVLKKLRTARGATIAQLGEATGWQAHSVRGFLSAVVRKKLALPLVSEPGKDGVRRYRIAEDAQSVE